MKPRKKLKREHEPKNTNGPTTNEKNKSEMSEEQEPQERRRLGRGQSEDEVLCKHVPVIYDQEVRFMLDKIKFLPPKCVALLHTFHFLVSVDVSLKSSLRYKAVPKIDKCLRALEALKHVSLVADNLLSYPDIIRTVEKIRQYHVDENVFPKSQRSELNQKAEAIRAKASEIMALFFMITNRRY